ncbi:MAG: glycoside hydrolase family 32 protein, partial [Cellulosimicrobium cellulans]
MSSPDLAATDFARLAAAHPDPAFPHFHPRPAQGWINDPNGVSHINGRYHVFFQYNPESARHHKIAWGHVSSADLVRWEEHPVALHPQDGGPDEYGCWTGVVTDDGGVPTAAYSGVRGD